MKKTALTIITILFLGLIGKTYSQCLSEDFVSFTDWTNYGTTSDAVHCAPNDACRALVSGNYLISPVVNNPSQLSFMQDASNGGNGQTANVYYKIGSGEWTLCYSFTVSTAESIKTVDLTNIDGVNLSTQSLVSFKFTSTFYTWYIDDVNVVCGANECSAPLTQCASVGFLNVCQTSMIVDWIRGSGEQVIVLAKQGSAVDVTPVEGINYNANSTFGLGSEIGTGNYVVYIGSSTSVSISGLTSNSNYQYAVCEFNDCSGEKKYNTTNPARGTQTTSGQKTISCSGSLTTCNNAPVTLTAELGTSYLWTNGATTRTINVGSSGTYNVTVTSGTCSFTSTVVTVGVNPFTSQSSLLTEGMGSVTSTTAISSNTFDNSTLTFTGTADIRNTTPSTGYEGASGNANVCFTTTGTYYFQMSGVNTSQYENAKMSFGLYKSTSTSTGSEFTIEVSTDGTNFTPLTYTLLPTGSNTAIWYLREVLLPSSSSLTIKFSKTTGTTLFRLDDINITGNLLESNIIDVTGLNTYCSGGNVQLSANIGSSFLWSNDSTTQTINVAENGTYNVTITDNYGCSTNGNKIVTLPTALILSHLINYNSCSEENNVQVNLDVTGGVFPYSFLWSNGANTQNISNIISGNYNVTISDNNGCNLVHNLKISNENIVLNENAKYIIKNSSFFDEGDTTSYYTNNKDYLAVFYPCENTNKIRISFSNFALEGNCDNDYVKIYDGPDQNSALIGTYCGNTNIGTIISTHESGALTFVFHSNESIVSSGWKANIDEFTPLTINAIIKNETLDSLGSVNLQISGGYPPYAIFGNGDDLLTITEINELFVNNPSLDTIFSTPQAMYDSLFASANLLSYGDLKAGKYLFKIYDSNGGILEKEIIVETNIIMMDSIGLSVNNKTITKTNSDGWNNGIITIGNIINKVSEALIEFSIDQINFIGAIGFRNFENIQSSTYTDIDFGLFFENNQVKSINNGIAGNIIGSYIAGDIFSIIYDGTSKISYYKGTTLLQEVYVNNDLSEYNQTDIFVYRSSTSLTIKKIVASPREIYEPINTYSINNVTCYNQNSGRIEVFLKSGITDVQYSWYLTDPNSPIAIGVPILSGVPMGIYNLRLTYKKVGATKSFTNYYKYEILSAPDLDQNQIGYTNNIDENGLDIVSEIDGLNLITNNYFADSKPIKVLFETSTSNGENIKIRFSESKLFSSTNYQEILILNNFNVIYIKIKHYKNKVLVQDAVGKFRNTGTNVKYEIKQYYDNDPSVLAIYRDGIFCVSFKRFFMGAGTFLQHSVSNSNMAVNNILTNVNCSKNNVYLDLSESMEGGYYSIRDKKLFFRYFEEYNTIPNAKLSYKIFNNDNEIELNSTIITNTENITYGNNWFEFDFTSFQSGKYLMEITTSKNEKKYLKFKLL